MTTLEGERVVLRSLHEDDAEPLARYWSENRAHLEGWQSGSFERLTSPAYWTEKLPKLLADPRHRRFAIVVREGIEERNVIHGLANLHEVVADPLWSAMLGYSMAARFEGKGLMHDSIKLLIRFGFDVLNLHKVYASYVLRNARSARLLERLGFTYEGRLRSHLLVDGVWQDLDQMSLVNESWVPPRPSP